MFCWKILNNINHGIVHRILFIRSGKFTIGPTLEAKLLIVARDLLPILRSQATDKTWAADIGPISSIL